MNNAGYRTGYIGKWHLDGVPRDKFTPPGRRRLGFESWAVHNCTHDYSNSFYYANEPERIPIDGYEPRTQTRLAMQFLREARHDPFCLVLSYGPPHNPYHTAPEPYAGMYDPARLHVRDNVPDGEVETAAEELAGYYAHVSAVDAQIGMLLMKLDELGLAEQTLMIFTSDHGDMLHSHGRTRKQQPFEECLHIPAIFRLPGVIPRGRTVEGLLSLCDLLPTVLQFAGMRPPRALDGRSRVEMIAGQGRGAPEVLLGELCPCDEAVARDVPVWRGLHTGRYCFATTHTGAWVLHDLQRDPQQIVNLADEPRYEFLVDDLTRRLDRHLADVDDPFANWEDMIQHVGQVEAWNARERHMSPGKPRLIETG